MNLNTLNYNYLNIKKGEGFFSERYQTLFLDKSKNSNMNEFSYTSGFDPEHRCTRRCS